MTDEQSGVDTRDMLGLAAIANLKPMSPPIYMTKKSGFLHLARPIWKVVRPTNNRKLGIAVMGVPLKPQEQMDAKGAIFTVFAWQRAFSTVGLKLYNKSSWKWTSGSRKDQR